MSLEKSQVLRSRNPVNKSIVPSIVKGSLVALIVQPIWALIVAYMFKKEFALQFVTSTLKVYVEESNIPFAILAILAAFQWMIMPAWTVTSRIDFGNYNFQSPRDSQHNLSGSGERLQSAYDNAIETYPSIVAAILISQFNQVPVEIRVNLSVLYLVFRSIWLTSYLANIPALRAITFNLANWSMLHLFAFSIIINYTQYFNILTSYF